ncbi:MAG: phosphoglycolate phosphatase [Steroidobacter sp.]
MRKPVDCIEAVAFDLDGTLIDTAPDLGAAANMMLVILGGRPLPEQRIPTFIGAGVGQFVARVLTASLNETTPDPALQASAAALFRNLYAQRLFERSHIYPGVREALLTLQAARLTLCCITNKESRFAGPLLEAAGLRAFFEFTLCADRAEDRKPSPNLLLAACARLGVEPRRLLYVGDSRADIVAARAAGCRVVAVDYGYHHDLSLAETLPEAIVGSLTQIVPLCAPPRSGARAPDTAKIASFASDVEECAASVFPSRKGVAL